MEEESNLQQVITQVDMDPDFLYAIWVSYLEIYNERIFDLLDDNGLSIDP